MKWIPRYITHRTGSLAMSCYWLLQPTITSCRNSFFTLSLFLPPPLFFWPYLIPTHCSVEDYCCTLSHPLTHIHLVGTFWTSKRLVAETCTCTIHKIHKRHPCPRRDSNTQSQQASERAAADVLLRPHGHRDRHVVTSQRKYSHFKWSYKYIEKRIKSCWRLEAVP